MINLQNRADRDPSPRGFGSVLGGILGVPMRNLPPMPGAIVGYGGGTFDLDGRQVTSGRSGEHAWPVQGPRGDNEVARAATFPDPSPPDLQPMNAPGGNDPTPLQQTRPDYRTMIEEALGPRPELHGARKWAAILGPALMAASGNQAGANAMIQHLAEPGRDWDARNRQARLLGVQWQREEDREAAKRNEPQFFSGNEDRIRFDPITGKSTRVYDAPQDFEDYARAQGLEPGTDGYFTAVEDYVLRGNGPTAFQYDKDLEAVRQAGRISQEAARQANRLGVIDYRNANPPPARPRAASSGSPRERLPIVSSPAEAMKLPPGTRFKVKGTNQVKVRP